jgi:hypothetical protein
LVVPRTWFYAALRVSVTPLRFATNAARFAPRVQGITTFASAAVLVTDLIKRVLVFISGLLLDCDVGVLPFVDHNMTNLCGRFLTGREKL